MNIYLIEQEQQVGYNTYDSAVVVAATEQDAKEIIPGGSWNSARTDWCSSAEHVTAELIGTATEGMEAGVILASYNAG